MKFCLNFRNPEFRFKKATIRTLPGLLLLMALASCASEGARNAELAAQEAAQVASEQEATRQAQAQERTRAADLERQRRALAAEQARLQAQLAQQAAEEQARVEQEQREREAAERQERERLAVAAEAAEERQERLDRINALEQQIAAIRSDISDDEASIDLLQQAIVVAEELLAALDTEEAKYDDTDTTGNTVQPLARELIAEIEARKDALISQIGAQ